MKCSAGNRVNVPPTWTLSQASLSRTNHSGKRLSITADSLDPSLVEHQWADLEQGWSMKALTANLFNPHDLLRNPTSLLHLLYPHFVWCQSRAAAGLYILSQPRFPFFFFSSNIFSAEVLFACLACKRLLCKYWMGCTVNTWNIYFFSFASPTAPCVQ